MYTDEIKTLYLNKSKLNLFSPTGSLIPYEAEIGDYCSIAPNDISVTSSDYSPDYALRGTLVFNIGAGNPRFYISENGEQLLLITGLKTGQVLSPFRLSNTIFSSYWEQKTMGYLFQVINYKL